VAKMTGNGLFLDQITVENQQQQKKKKKSKTQLCHFEEKKLKKKQTRICVLKF
jgi:hypothetical protein